jgi:hypothetical protein
METNEKRTLFFLKSPKHNLTAIETFLNKRDFTVISISDYKEAVAKIIPLNPDYIFLAWDHPKETVTNLPKLLSQSCTSKVIPYINTSDKFQHRKLQSSPFDIKLFPPLSGPGIQRMIAKIEMSEAAAEKALLEQDNKDNASNSAFSGERKSEMVQVRSTFSQDHSAPNTLNRNESTLLPEDNSNESDRHRKNSTFLRGDSSETQIQNRNESTLLDDEDSDQSMFKEKTRADQLREFQQGLLSLQNNSKTSEPTDSQEKQKTEILIQKGMKDHQTSEGAMSSDLMTSGRMSASQREKINHSYLETVKTELLDYLGNYEDIKATMSEPGTVTMINPESHYCLVIQSAQWVGYLVISSEISFERQSLEFILSKWVYENFGFAENQAEDLVNTSPLFEISIKKISYLDFALKASDLTTIFEYNEQKMILSFFSINPQHIFLRLHEKFDMIRLSLDELPFEQNLGFDVCLYMPENEKFLTYTKKNSKIQKIHLDRLKEKMVQSVYSNYENEVALQKFRAENQLNQKVQDYLKEIAANEPA